MSPLEPNDPAALAAEQEKLQAEADSLKTKALKEAREEREASELGATALREAERRQKVAEAEKAVAAAKREQVTALIPDFKDVGRGTLEDKSDKPMFEVALAQRALADAASKAATVVRMCLDPPEGKCVLVTSDAELSASDATYQDVVVGLSQLTAACEEALAEPGTDPLTDDTGTGIEVETFVPLAPMLSAVASAIPALLGVFSARRTLKGSDVAKNDLAAAAALAGAIRAKEGQAPSLVHDDVRVLPAGGVYSKHATLVTLRRRLTTLKLELEAQRAQVPEGDKASLSRVVLRLARVDTVSSAIDQFNTSLVMVPEGATRSSLSAAASREQLHDGTFTHVLVVKSEGGSVHQSIDDKPFMFGDKVSIAAAASITWILVEVATNHILGADAAGGTATAHGKIGDQLEISIG